MDEIVLRAMAKWPDVPDVFGWLALDRRGRWLLRGERIGNQAANEFMSRNYACDEHGQWYFQNGPQRVFVELHYTPWVVSLDGRGQLLTHTGLAVAHLESAWVDEEMNLLLLTNHGIALVHDQDLAPVSESFVGEDGEWLADDALEHVLSELALGHAVNARLRWAGQSVAVGFIEAAVVPDQFGFDPLPEEGLCLR